MFMAKKTKSAPPILNNGTISATVPGPSMKMDEFDKLALMVVTGVPTGSPTVDVKLQYLEPLSGLWCDVQGQTMTQITAQGNFAKDFSNVAGRNVRIVPVFGGTGSFANCYISGILKS